MTLPLRLGKTRSLRRMATPAGHFHMIAIDQRPPIAAAIARARGIAPHEVAFADMCAVKRLLAGQLAAHASAMLLDPNYAIPAALAHAGAHTGLLVTLEDHRFSEDGGGRMSQPIADWSVAQIKRLGGDGVKLLAWYRPDTAAHVIQHQRQLVERIGQECLEHDIAFVLELLIYPLADETPLAPVRRAELVLESVREFVHPRYGVDLLKLESPLPAAELPAPGSAAAQATQAQFDAMGAICRAAAIPWVMLSAGVSGAQFARVMQYACAAGASGFLAGRAIWGEALAHWPDEAAVAAHLQQHSVPTLASLCQLTARAATPWQPHWRALDALQASGMEGDFCRAYSRAYSRAG